MNDMLQTRTLTYNLRSQRDFARRFVNISRSFASIMLNIFQSGIKNARNIHIFRNKIRKWEPEEYHCNLCRPCVSNLGLLIWCKQDLTSLCQQSQSLRWCRAQYLFGSQIPVTTGQFKLRISCIKTSYLTHQAMRPNRLEGFRVPAFATLRQQQLIHVGILQLQAKFQTAMVSCSRFAWITNPSDHRRV